MNPFTKQWDHNIKIGDLHKSREDGKITVGQCAHQLAARLKRVKGTQLYSDLEPYIEELLEMDESANDADAIDEYDYVLSGIYDMADIGKRLWLDPG